MTLHNHVQGTLCTVTYYEADMNAAMTLQIQQSNSETKLSYVHMATLEFVLQTKNFVKTGKG